MLLKDLISYYKGEIEFVVKRISQDEAEDIVSFDVPEVGAIKDEILDSEISKWYVDNSSKVNLKVVALLKSVTETTNDSTEGNESTS